MARLRWFSKSNSSTSLLAASSDLMQFCAMKIALKVSLALRYFQISGKYFSSSSQCRLAISFSVITEALSRKKRLLSARLTFSPPHSLVLAFSWSNTYLLHSSFSQASCVPSGQLPAVAMENSLSLGQNLGATVGSGSVFVVFQQTSRQLSMPMIHNLPVVSAASAQTLVHSLVSMLKARISPVESCEKSIPSLEKSSHCRREVRLMGTWVLPMAATSLRKLLIRKCCIANCCAYHRGTLSWYTTTRMFSQARRATMGRSKEIERISCEAMSSTRRQESVATAIHPAPMVTASTPGISSSHSSVLLREEGLKPTSLSLANTTPIQLIANAVYPFDLPSISRCSFPPTFIYTSIELYQSASWRYMTQPYALTKRNLLPQKGWVALVMAGCGYTLIILSALVFLCWWQSISLCSQASSRSGSSQSNLISSSSTALWCSISIGSSSLSSRWYSQTFPSFLVPKNLPLSGTTRSRLKSSITNSFSSCRMLQMHTSSKLLVTIVLGLTTCVIIISLLWKISSEEECSHLFQMHCRRCRCVEPAEKRVCSLGWKLQVRSMQSSSLVI